MQYREKLIEMIKSGNPDAYNDWFAKQPLILQPDIAREFIEIVQELAKERGIELDKEDLQGFIAQTENYEEAILNEQVSEVNVHLANLAVEDSIKQMDEATNGIREYVIECIVTNADNAPQMKQLAQQLIDIEKESGTYDAGNWKAIL
jgi:hypothetical protein